MQCIYMQLTLTWMQRYRRYTLSNKSKTKAVGGVIQHDGLCVSWWRRRSFLGVRSCACLQNVGTRKERVKINPFLPKLLAQNLRDFVSSHKPPWRNMTASQPSPDHDPPSQASGAASYCPLLHGARLDSNLWHFFVNENDMCCGCTWIAIYLSECDIRVKNLALEVQKKFWAKTKKPEATDDIEEAI